GGFGRSEDQEPASADAVNDQLADRVGIHDGKARASRWDQWSVEGDLLDYVGGYAGRTQARNTDPAGPQVQRQRLGESHDGMLGRGVGQAVEPVWQQAR